jgi:hypothetical protein
MRIWGSLAALALAVTFAPAASAALLPDGGVTAQEMADVLQSKGYQTALSKDQHGDPVLLGSSNGLKFAVFFYDCDKSSRCSSIQFTAGFENRGVGAGLMAEWNRTMRFGTAYLDRDGDIQIEMDVDLMHGATTEAIAGDLDRWSYVLDRFTHYIDW